MAEAIRMPLLSDTMKEGVIAEWHKKVGDTVKADDVIAEVETDKATMEVMPYIDGTLLYIGVEKGKAAKVNDLIAIIGKPGEDFQSLLDEEKQEASASSDSGEAEGKTKEKNGKKDAEPQKTKEAPAVKPQDATVVRMPLLSDTMKEGKIQSWLKEVGDTVKSDDVIAEVETDKAVMEVMPYVDGTLVYLGVEAGESVPVNGIIAIIGKEGTDVEAVLQYESQQESSSNQTEQTEQKEQKEQSETSSTSQASSLSDEDAQGGQTGDRIRISPLARKLAEEKGYDIRQIKGSGDHGRIIKRDIEQYVPKAASAPEASTAATGIMGQESYKDIDLSNMRQVIARRLSESKFQAPHFYLTISVVMDGAMAARKAINEVSSHKVSFNDLIIKASAMALRQHPEVNSSWMGDKLRQYEHIHIGTAVALPEGLIVPVIRFADQKSLSQIAADSSTLIDKARNKKLQPAEFSGNTFSVSNLGMMDIDEFTAIINPPDSCILAVGKIAPTPVVEDGTVQVRQIMKLTLSCDHRVVDGALGARFLGTLKTFLENPVTMLA